MDELANFTFVRLRRFKLNPFMLLSLCHQVTAVNAFLFVVEDLS